MPVCGGPSAMARSTLQAVGVLAPGLGTNRIGSSPGRECDSGQIDRMSADPIVCAELPFTLVESVDADGLLRLRLVGELDLAVADQLLSRLGQLIEEGTPARLDLAELDFIDSTGIQTLIRGVGAGRTVRGDLFELDRELTPQVRRVIDLIGAAPLLWPSGSR
jgi:anti-sigma B factor antagonist